MYDRMQGTNYVSFNSVNGREFINLNRNLTEDSVIKQEIFEKYSKPF